MKYTTNGVFDYVEGKTNLTGRPVYCTSVYEPLQEEFPCAYIHETSHVREREYITLDFKDDQHRSSWEAQIFSNKTNGGLAECYSILSDVEDAFNDMYYRETYRQQVTNADPTIIRVVARFERLVCGSDQMPE